MPTYQITSPDGKKYRVTAPDGATEQDAIAYVQSGNVPEIKTARQGNAGGSSRAFAYGVTGGQIPFGNVITSGIGAGIAKAASPFTGYTRSYRELYDQAQADTKATQEANPNATLAGNVLGVISTLPAAFSKPVQGSSLLQLPAKGLQEFGKFTTKMASATPFKSGGLSAWAGNMLARSAGGAAVAAPIGGLYAAGDADAGKRLERAAKGGALALGTGFAAPFVLPVAGTALGLAAKPITSALDIISKNQIKNSIIQNGGKISDVSDKAISKVIERLKADFPDPIEYQNALNKFIYGQKSLAEIGGARTTNLAKGSAQYPSGEAAAKEFIYPKAAAIPEKVKSNVSTSVSKNTDYYSTLDDVISKGQEKASPLYREAFSANPSVSSRNIDNILSTPAGKKALSGARTIMQNDRSLMGLPNKELGDISRELAQMGKMAETEGGVASGLNLRSLDYVKKSLDDQYSIAVKAGEKSNARAILDLKKSLVDELDKADKSGAYAKARKTAGDYLSASNAMDEGLNYHLLDADLLKRKMADMGATDREAFKVGVVKKIRDDIDKATSSNMATGGRDVVSAVFGNQAKMNKIKSIIGEKQFTKLQSDLVDNQKIYALRNEVLGGSPTASKTVAAKEFDEESLDTIGKAVTGQWSSIAKDKVIKMVNKLYDGLSDKTAGDVAKILYETDPKKKIEILNKMKVQGAEGKKAIGAYFKVLDKEKSIQSIKNKSPILNKENKK